MGSAAEAGRSFNFSRASVLIVDANPLCMELFTNILRGFGFRTSHRANTLEAATDIVKMHTVDLILIDPFQFGEGAFNFVQWLRGDISSANRNASILMVTSHTPVRLISAARQSGADYVISKPFSVSALLDRILWVACSEGRRGELMAPTELVSSSGSGVEMW